MIMKLKLHSFLKIIGLLFCLPSLAAAQGITFQSGVSWEQIKAKAASENKYIFIDCYATWCGPCKKMDQEVYTDEKVGGFFNEHFLSVKVQMDSTAKDNASVREWYPVANHLLSADSIGGYPTFLFFSPTGMLVHQAIGFRNAKAFIELGHIATDPNKQFFTLLAKYDRQGPKGIDVMELTKTARELGRNGTAERIAKDYVRNTLDHLSPANLYTKSSLEFIGDYLVHSAHASAQPEFRLFYKNTAKINQVTSPGYAEGIIDFIVSSEDILPKLKQLEKMLIADPTLKAEPNWKQLTANIAKKYNRTIAERNVYHMLLKWYDKFPNAPLLLAAVLNRLDKYGIDTSGMSRNFMPDAPRINNNIWIGAVDHRTDKPTLTRCLFWMKKLIDLLPAIYSYTDTYAHLLYFDGQREEAINEEKTAITLWRQENPKHEQLPVPSDLQKSLEAMQNGNLTQ